MHKLAVRYYREGFNCSQCILKAAETTYNIRVPKEAFNMCKGVVSGFGTGSFCCALVGAIMVFGHMFDEIDTKHMRILLLDSFLQRYGSTQCSILISRTNDNCEQIIADIADMTQQIIERFS